MQNSVELIDIHGNDEIVALRAWTSTGIEITDKHRERIPEFVKQLASEKHTVPFEHTLISFRVKSDIATHIHFLKHRIGVSISSQSFRWKEQKTDAAYVPDDWNDEWKENLVKFQDTAFQLYHAAIESLVDGGMERKRAKETARFFLPYSTMLEYIVTFNLHSFAKFCILRHDPHAQKEIRDLCHQMIGQVEDTRRFPAALEGWKINTGEIRGWQIGSYIS